MPRQLALLLCIAFACWLFARDRKLRPMTSGVLWIPLLWMLIITSRPVSAWFDAGIHMQTPDDYLEGSPFDRNVYLLLMLTGLIALFRRGVEWRRVFVSNRWLLVFFLYWGVSVMWSDYSFVAVKRWTKDVSNIVMVLIILTETDPANAVRATLSRLTYVVVPFSVLLIKYYGELGRYLSSTWENHPCGVTIEKNALGCLALVAGMFLVWDLMEARTGQDRKTDHLDLCARIILLVMTLWLIDTAKSSTALVCLFFGLSIILISMRTKLAKTLIRHLGTYALVACVGIVLFYSIPGIMEASIEILGKDTTLTGRTELWKELMGERINSWLGTGYQSFWLGPRAFHYWEKWNFHPNQAHNGYLETYLTGGLIGIALLLIVLISTFTQLKKRLLHGEGLGILLFGYYVVILIYNWTEAMFNKMSPLWFLLLLAAIPPPARPQVRR